MRKPSIFNSDYQKIMRKRRIAFRAFIILAALTVIFVTYNKSAVPNLKRFAENIKSSTIDSISKLQKSVFENNQNKNNSTSGKTEQNKLEDQKKIEEQKKLEEAKKKEEQAKQQIVKGEFFFKFPVNESFSVVYEKQGNDIKITGIKPADMEINFDIRDDGKAIVFDNPRSSDIWLLAADGSSRKLNSDNYKEFAKKGIMEQYDNKYAWAERPKFLKDGRIVYQSHLPWFKETNNYYLWIVNSDGTDNRMILPINQTTPAKYSGYTGDGKLIIEIGGSRYTFSTEDRSKQKLE